MIVSAEQMLMVAIIIKVIMKYVIYMYSIGRITFMALVITILLNHSLLIIFSKS